LATATVQEEHRIFEGTHLTANRTDTPILIDENLSRALELTEGTANAEFVEIRARLQPASGAEWKNIGGTLAMFDGTSSPITQTFGLGICGAATEDQLAEIEQFFQERGAPVFHEISPLAPAELLTLLRHRHYAPIELTNVLIRPISTTMELPQAGECVLSVRSIHPGEQSLWARLAARGWSQDTEFADLIYDLSLISAHRSPEMTFIAERGGEPVATGAMFVHDRIALLAGASTIPEARKQGAQNALLAGRLKAAAAAGCDLAMMCALPGSPSQRNAQRQGFQIAYTRIKWQKFT
jgi:hypothetical protein